MITKSLNKIWKSRKFSYLCSILHTERRLSSLNLRAFIMPLFIATALHPRVGALMRPLPFRCRITGQAEPFFIRPTYNIHLKSYKMKNQQSATNLVACPFATQSPINPIFVDCLQKLRDVFAQITEFCEDEQNPQYDALGSYHEQFYVSIDQTAYNIGQIAQVDFVERNFYVNEPVGKEAQNA